MQHILLLHGALGAKDQLEPLAEQLTDQFVVHLLNFGGHGGEPFPDNGFSIPVFANEVLAYLDKEKIDRINIFGYSMGGYVALYLAKHHAARVNKLVTLATKFEWDEPSAAKEVKMLDPGIILEKVPAFARQLEQRHAPNDWKMVLQKTGQMMLGLGRKNELSSEDYSDIAASSLLLLGDKDKMVTLEETAAVAKTLQNGQFHLLEDTAHPFEKVDMERLAALIIKHIG